MVFSKPLSYPNVEILIRFLDPSLRFRLSRQCPSIRSCEKKHPFILKFLALNKHSITLNATSYQLAIFQDSDIPLELPFDVDVRGSRDMNLVVEKRREEILIDGRFHRFHRFNGQNPVSPGAAQCNQFIQLTVGSYIERMMYSRKLHDALFYMIKKLLVGKLSIKAHKFCLRSSGILRIPQSLKIQTKHVQLEGPHIEQLLKVLPFLLDTGGTPLSSFTFSETLVTTEKLDFDIVRTAGILIFQWSTLINLFDLRHRRVYFKRVGLEFILQVIRNFLEHGRDFDTHYSFEGINEQAIFKALELQTRVYKEIRHNCVTFYKENFMDIVKKA